jgi:hypothetical protein
MSGLQDPAIISFAELELRSRFPVELNLWVDSMYFATFLSDFGKG